MFSEVPISANKMEWPATILQTFYKQYPFFVASNAEVKVDDTTLNDKVVSGVINFDYNGLPIIVPFFIRDSKLLPIRIMFIPSDTGEDMKPILITKENFENYVMNMADIGTAVPSSKIPRLGPEVSVVDKPSMANQNPLANAERIALINPEANKIKLAHVVPSKNNFWKVLIYEAGR